MTRIPLETVMTELENRGVRTEDIYPNLGVAAVSGADPAMELVNQRIQAAGHGAEGLSAEATEWMHGELGQGLESWRRYQSLMAEPAPDDVAEFFALAKNPNALNETFTRLYEAKQALIDSGETNPAGLNVGETMRLVLVPWAAMKESTRNIRGWVGNMRSLQAIDATADFINEDLEKAIVEDKPLYRDPANPALLLTPTQYLDRKIEQEGSWGVMLVQTSDDAGLKRIVDGPASQRSPDAMTDNGSTHFEVAGQQVDAMGIFEWFSLTFQEDPRALSSKDWSWFLANRLGSRVPDGYWRDDHVRSLLCDAGDDRGDGRARLAVM